MRVARLLDCFVAALLAMTILFTRQTVSSSTPRVRARTPTSRVIDRPPPRWFGARHGGAASAPDRATSQEAVMNRRALLQSMIVAATGFGRAPVGSPAAASPSERRARMTNVNDIVVRYVAVWN